jgi:tRNA threonylcarbamoyladenosine biosynthesis protein TsaB
MNLLALDTSTEYLSLALLYGGELLARDWWVPQKHAEMALPEARRLLAEAGAKFADLEGIAVSIGPGSFTGLRIGCGIAQGLAFGLDIPTVGVNTLLALAADSTAPKVLAALDARMGEFYVAAFEQTEDGWREALPSTVCAPDKLPAIAGKGWHGVGTGFAVAGGALAAHYGDQLVQVDTKSFPHARGVLKIAQKELEVGRGQAAEKLELLYVRDKVALKTSERQRA